MTIHHPLTLDDQAAGEHFVFHGSARGRRGRFAFTWTLAPGKTGPGEHTHVETEHFAVTSGTLRIWVRGAPKDLRPGDTFAVAPGVPHRFLNPGDVPVVVEVELDGTRMEDQMVPLAVFFQARRAAGATKPSFGDLARMLVHIERTGAVAMASRVKMAAFRGVARTFRLFGARPFEPVVDWEPA